MNTDKKQLPNGKTPAPSIPDGGQMSISPPANVKNKYQTLSSGIDSLNLAIDVHWEKDSFFEYLASLKQQAQEQEEELPGVLKAEDNIGEWKFAIKPHGSDGYEWLLTGKAFALRIGNWKIPKTRPSIMVEIRSEALWHLGATDCVNGLTSLLRGAGASNIQIKPSRVDLCVDLLFPADEWNIDLIFYRVTRAHKSQVYLQNDRFTGFMIGGGKFAARAYDKAFEIEKKSKKTWMYSIWGIDTVPDDQKIIRFEFQTRREALKELGINTFDDLFSFQDNLWAYCSQKWLKFMDNPGKHQVTQRNVLPWWSVVQNGFNGIQDAHPLIRGIAFRKDRNQLFAQSQGLLSSLVALHLEEVGNTDKEIDFNDLLMANFESSFNEGRNETFKEKVLKKFYKYQRLQTKTKQIKQERSEHGFPF